MASAYFPSTERVSESLECCFMDRWNPETMTKELPCISFLFEQILWCQLNIAVSRPKKILFPWIKWISDDDRSILSISNITRSYLCIFAFQCSDRLLWFARKLVQDGGSFTAKSGCSRAFLLSLFKVSHGAWRFYYEQTQRALMEKAEVVCSSLLRVVFLTWILERFAMHERIRNGLLLYGDSGNFRARELTALT